MCNIGVVNFNNLKRIKDTAILLVVLASSFSGKCQSILISNNGGVPDSSAILDIRSSSKGLLPSSLTAAERRAISSPAQGLFLFQDDTYSGYFYYTGSQWDTIKIDEQTITVLASNSKIATIVDKKPTGTDGGTFTAGDWRTRTINYQLGDSSFVSLIGDTAFSLTTGVYEIQVLAPALGVDQHQIRLENLSLTSIQKLGSTEKALTASSNSYLSSIITVSSSNETFQVSHRGTSTQATTGFGKGTSSGDNFFTQIVIKQL